MRQSPYTKIRGQEHDRGYRRNRRPPEPTGEDQAGSGSEESPGGRDKKLRQAIAQRTLGADMGKGDRKKGRKIPKGIPALAKIEKKKQPRQGGRFTMADDPQETALMARARHLDVDYSRAAKPALACPQMGHPLGVVMLVVCDKSDVARLWSVFYGFCQAERTYRMRYLGQSGSPKGATIQMAHERFETEQSHTVDVRSNEEKDRDAVNNWMRWRGYIGHLRSEMASLLYAAERGDGPVLVRGPQPTDSGRETLKALMALSDVSETKGCR